MANLDDLQEEENGSMRKEFHQLIVPLIRQSLHDKPTDVAAYCARYFQTVLEQRQRGNESEKIGESIIPETTVNAAKNVTTPQVQESTSLPILTDVHRDPLSIRETSSWNNPSSSSSKPRRLRNISYDVADASSCNGDQPDKDLQEYPEAKESEKQLFVGDDGGKDIESREVRSDDPSKKRSIVEDSTVDGELEEDSGNVLPASSFSAATLSASYRKKWSSNVDSTRNLIFKSEFSEAIDDEEPVPDSSPKRYPPNDHEVESPSVSTGSSLPDSSLGHISQHKKLKSSPRTRQNSTPFIQKEIEDSVKIVRHSLQELLKVLDSMKFFCNENLQRVKTLGKALPEKSLRAPRKKRSVTTFSSSDDLIQSRQFLGGPESRPASSAAGRGCSKLSPDSKRIDSVAESDYPLKSRRAEDSNKSQKITPIKENEDGTNNNLDGKKGIYFDKNLDQNDRDSNGNRIGSKNAGMNGKFGSKEGIVNKGFLMDDSELHRRSHRPGHQSGPNWWQDNGPRRRMFNGQNPFSQIRISRPHLGRNINLSQPHNRTPRQMPGYQFSYIGEGGDVFSTSQGQCSVATATEATQTTERVGVFEAGIRSMRIHPVANGIAEQEGCASKQSNGESRSQVSEKESQSHKSSLSDEQSSKPCEVQTSSALEFSSSVVTDSLSDEQPSKPCEVQTSSALESSSSVVTDEEVRAQERGTEIKPSKKSSSLNPCAECFKPPSKLVQNLEGLKSSDENDEPISDHGGSDLIDVPIDLIEKSFPGAEVDWDYEMFLDDFLLDDQEPILYQSLDSDGQLVSLTIEEVEGQHKFENECSLLDRLSYSLEKNDGSGQGHDGGPPCLKKEDDKKHNRQSDMKLAEGDQGLEPAEEGAERCDSAEKREEPGLSSACGDFVAAENNNEGGEENPGDDAGNAQVAVAPDLIAFDAEIPEFLPADGNGSSPLRVRQEELELNFACFSGSDSSEVDSSDISEEETEFSGEIGEKKLKETA